MSLITDLENQNFDGFLKAFHELHAKKETSETNDTATNEVIEAIIKFNELLLKEYDQKYTQNITPAPFIKIAKENPILFIYCFFSEALKAQKFYLVKNHLSKFSGYSDNLFDPEILFKIITSVPIEHFYNYYPEKTNILFAVCPDLLSANKLFELATNSKFDSHYFCEKIADNLKSNVSILDKTRKEISESILNGLKFNKKGQPRLTGEVENKNFKPFLDAFYQAYRDAKPKNKGNDSTKTKESKTEKNIMRAILKFSNLLRDEIYSSCQQNSDQKSYIDIARQHPLVWYFAISIAGRSEGFHGIKTNFPDHVDKVASGDPKFLIGMIAYQHEFESFFNLFPEFNNATFLLSDEIVHLCSNFQGLYLYLQEVREQNKIDIEIDAKMKNNFMLSALKKLQKTTTHSVSHGFKDLSFLLKQGIPLNEAKDREGTWYQYLPWATLKEHQAFLFEHIQNITDKKEILAYLNKEYPHLVYNHYLTGNFFIANQLVEFGLEKPKVDPQLFLTEAIRLGLKNSRELKKHHALLLLQYRVKIIDETELKSADNLLHTPLKDSLCQKIDSNLPKLVQHYLEQYSLLNTIEDPLILNKLMHHIEKNYAIALSSIYNLPVLNGGCSLKCYRALTIPKSSINKKLLEHFLTYGHRAGFYSFFSHGYNRNVYEQLTEGPRMAWDCWSDTTCITPDIEVALHFVHPNEYEEAYLMSMSFKDKDPLFFGNWVNVGIESRGFPSQLELPYVAPHSIDGIFQLKHNQTHQKQVESAQHPAGVPLEESILLEGEICDLTPRSNELIKKYAKVFSEKLKPYLDFFLLPYSQYFKDYSLDTLLRSLAKNFDNFETVTDQLEMRLTQAISSLQVSSSSSASSSQLMKSEPSNSTVLQFPTISSTISSNNNNNNNQQNAKVVNDF